MAELVDAVGLSPAGENHGGSIPSGPTIQARSSTVEPSKDNDSWFVGQVRSGRISISREGVVISSATEKEIGATGSGRYPKISLQDPETKQIKSMQIHRLVYLVHVGPIPDGYEVDHKDGDKENRSADNLEAITPEENSRRARSMGKHNPFPAGNDLQAKRKSVGNRFGTFEKVASSNLAAPTNDISREYSGRGVAASASDPVTAGITNRVDEVTARLGEIPHSSVESSRPPQLTPVAQRIEHRTTNPAVGGSSPSGCATSKPPFAREVYQKLYMRALPLAKAWGMTVKEYWAAIGYNWKDHIND